VAVTIDAIATDLGVVTPAAGSITADQWEMWIGDAEMLIEERRIRVGFEGPVDPAKVDYAVRKAVVAHIKKPDDATQVTVAVDDGSTSRRYESGKGMVSLDDWWDYLGLLGNDSAAFTIRPAGRVDTEDVTW